MPFESPSERPSNQAPERLPAIFLDRDGVIIANRENYVLTWDDVEIYPQALSALAQISKSAYKIILITNQSAVGRGLLTPHAAEDINQKLLKVIAITGGRVDGLFMCPHAPQDECLCRKPKPGLIFQAAQALSIDLGRSILVGDALSDLQAGQAAGIPQVILLRTGRGAAQEKLPEALSIRPFTVFDTLLQSLSILIP